MQKRLKPNRSKLLKDAAGNPVLLRCAHPSYGTLPEAGDLVEMDLHWSRMVRAGDCSIIPPLAPKKSPSKKTRRPPPPTEPEPAPEPERVEPAPEE